jgi:hypothetical protein
VQQALELRRKARTGSHAPNRQAGAARAQATTRGRCSTWTRPTCKAPGPQPRADQGRDRRRAAQARRWAEQALLDKIGAAELARQRATLDQELAIAQQRLAQRLEELRAEVEAVVSKAGAVSPQLVAALQAFSDRALAERMAASMAPLAILGGKSAAESAPLLGHGAGKSADDRKRRGSAERRG